MTQTSLFNPDPVDPPVEGEPEVYTSNFARLKRLRAETRIVPLGIAVGPPSWYKGNSYPALAPSRPMLKMSLADYKVAFTSQLHRLNPEVVLDELRQHARAVNAPGVALLCWESPNVSCHRRLVAEWLESQCGITVCEYGFDRQSIMEYDAMPEKV